MPLTHTQPNATTRVYAKSLFELCMAPETGGGRHKVDETLDELEQIAELTKSHPQLGEVFASPSIGSDERSKAIQNIFAGRVSDTSYRFLQVLNEKGRIDLFPAIVQSFDEVVQERFGTIEANIYTAEPASPDMIRDITDRLSKTLGKQVVAHAYTEPSMIGGIKIMIGDQLLDASVATQLAKLKDQLTKQGVSSMRARLDNILGE